MSIIQFEENTRALFDTFRRNNGVIYIRITIAWYDEIYSTKKQQKVISKSCGPLQEDIYIKYIKKPANICSQVNSLLVAMGYDFNKLLQPNSIFMRKHVIEMFTDQYGAISLPRQFAIMCYLDIDERDGLSISQHALRVYMMNLDIVRGNYVARIHSQMPDHYLLPIMTDSMALYLRGHFKSRM